MDSAAPLNNCLQNAFDIDKENRYAQEEDCEYDR